jgi:ABC-type multidrug transport system ATPase subunit
MRDGKILREGTPAYLRSFLNDQIVELIGQPLAVLRQIASEDEGIEDAQLFGDRLHLRVKQGQREKVITRLKRQIVASGIQATRMNLIQPSLEDVFIALSETGPVQPPAVFKSGNGEKEAKV